MTRANRCIISLVVAALASLACGTMEGLMKRAIDEAYLRAKVGKVYGLYFVDTGSVELKLAGVSGTFRLRWIDIAKGGYAGTEQTLTGGSTVTITTPGSTTGGWAATIVKK